LRQICSDDADVRLMTSSRCQRFRFVVDTMQVGDRLDVTVNVTILTSVFLDNEVSHTLTVSIPLTL